LMKMQGERYASSSNDTDAPRKGARRMTSSGTRLVLVGGGPRAIGVLERLSASAALPAHAAHLARTPLPTHTVDPPMPGAGRIWRAEDGPLLLMNSHAADG